MRGVEQYEGVDVYPLTVGALIKNAAELGKLKTLCKEKNVSFDRLSQNPVEVIEALLPEVPWLLRVVTRKSAEEVEAMTLDVAVGVLALALRQNIGYIRKLFGPILELARPQEAGPSGEPIA